MRSILTLLGKYKQEVIIIPVIAIAAIIVTLIFYMIIKKKSLKYVVFSFFVMVGFIYLYIGYSKILEGGLPNIKTSVKLFVFGGVGILMSLFLDIMDSLLGMFKKKEGNISNSTKKGKKIFFKEKFLNVKNFGEKFIKKDFDGKEDEFDKKENINSVDENIKKFEKDNKKEDYLEYTRKTSVIDINKTGKKKR